jgi:hypothetical protein
MGDIMEDNVDLPSFNVGERMDGATPLNHQHMVVTKLDTLVTRHDWSVVVEQLSLEGEAACGAGVEDPTSEV